MTRLELIKKINKVKKKKNVSNYKIAQFLNCPISTVSRILNNEMNTGVDNILKICDFLEISVKLECKE
ncbi:MAG: helix-turn-helix domain-containing protein [Bergeyella cardium]